VKFAVDYPERLSRGKLPLKLLFGWLYVGIPHGIILGLYGIAVIIRNFEDRFVGKFIINFELSEGGIPGKHLAF